jgi:GNAT superfamily N-acetyltransferase
LCVKQEYRRCGVGTALVHACEDDVRHWPITASAAVGHDMREIVTQIDVDNRHSYDLFRKCGYHCHFTDRTCTNVTLDDVLFTKEITVPKHIMRKILFPTMW